MAKESWFMKDLVGDTSGHEVQRELMVVASAKKALSSRAGALAALGTIALAALTTVPSVLLLIPAVFMSIFALRLLDWRIRQASSRRARQLPMRLPDVEAFSDGRVKAIVRRLLTTRHTIEAVVETAPPGAAFDLSSLVAHVPELERQLVVLATRIEYLARFLELIPIAEARADFSRITACAANRGEAGCDEYQRAAEVCQGRVASALALNGELQRMLGRAEVELCELEALPIRLAFEQLRRLEACDDDGTGATDAAAGVAPSIAWCDITEAEVPARPPRGSIA